MGKKSLLALLMAAVLLVTTGCALIEKDEAVDRATEVIKVYESTYTKGQVQDAVQNSLYQTAMMYYYYLGTNFDVSDPTNIANAQQSVIDSMVEEGVKLHFAKEKGITAEKYADEMKETIDSQLAEDRANVIASYFADTELTGAELDTAVDAMMEDLGYNSAEYRNSLENAFLVDKLEEMVKADAVVTDADLQAELDTKAAADQEKYDADPAAWGTAVTNGTMTYYHPAGYRMVKNLLFQLRAEDQDAISAITSRKTAAEDSAATAETVLAGLAVEDIDAKVAKIEVTVTDNADTVEPDENGICVIADSVPETTVVSNLEGESDEVSTQIITLAKARALSAYYDGKIAEANEIALANIAGKADAAIERLKAGEDFSVVMAELTEDPGMQPGAANAEKGYPVCEASTNWDPAFKNAAMALEKVGDFSDKVAGSYGYYIIGYASDVTPGPVALDEVRDSLQNTVLTSKQTELWNSTVDAWVAGAKPTINTKSLK